MAGTECAPNPLEQPANPSKQTTLNAGNDRGVLALPPQLDTCTGGIRLMSRVQQTPLDFQNFIR